MKEKITAAQLGELLASSLVECGKCNTLAKEFCLKKQQGPWCPVLVFHGLLNYANKDSD